MLTITMVTPKGKKFDLGLAETFVNVKPYADLGQKAEWRIMNDISTSERSFLPVAKTTTREICRTDKITPGANENELARQAADVSASKPCLKATN